MKVNLFLCICMVLIHEAVLDYSYVRISLPEMHVIGAYNNEALNQVAEALEDPNAGEPPMEGLTIFIQEDWKVPNEKIPVVPTDFKASEDALSLINNLVSAETSKKIRSLVSTVSEHTTVVLVNTVNNLHLPHEGGSGWKTQLTGEYNTIEDESIGVTLIEVPYSKYMSFIYAIPSPGREATVEKALTPKSIDLLRRAMINKVVDIEVTRVTMCAAFFMSVDKVAFEDGTESYRMRFGYKQAATIP